MTFIISWHCSLGGNFLADTLRYLSWPALSRSWHLAASGMGLGVMSHQAGLLTTLHHIHICFPEQGGNMVTTMGWGSHILGTYSVLPYWWIKLACITTIYHWCIYSIVLQMNAGFPFPLIVMALIVNIFLWNAVIWHQNTHGKLLFTKQQQYIIKNCLDHA